MTNRLLVGSWPAPIDLAPTWPPRRSQGRPVSGVAGGSCLGRASGQTLVWQGPMGLMTTWLCSIEGPLAATQPFEKLFSKPYFAGPNSFFPPGNPSFQVAPPTSNHGFPGGKRPFGPPKSGFDKTSQWVGSLPGALLLKAILLFFSLGLPSPGGFRGRVRTVIFQRRSVVFARIRGGGGG